MFSGGGATWAQSSIVTETAGNANDGFGSDLAVAGPTLVVGAGGAANAAGDAIAFGGVSPAVTTSATITSTTTTTTTTTASSSAVTTSTGATTSSSVAKGSPGSGGPAPRNYATVTAVGGGPGRATVSLTCPATSGKCVAANAELVVQERLAGNRIVATRATVDAGYRRITLGAAHVTLAARARTTLVLSVNPSGRLLLGSRARISAGLSVSSVGRVLRLATVTITRPARR